MVFELAQSLVFHVYIVVFICSFVLVLLDIVLSDLLQFTVSDTISL